MKNNVTRREFLATTAAAVITTAAIPVWAQETKKMTVAFVGVAHIHAPGYLELVKKRPDVQIKYVWDHDAARAAQRAKQVAAQVPSDLNAIWSDPEVVAVIILSETNLHHQLVLAAAKAGKHIFAEKPLGISASESRDMAEAIEKAGLLFNTGYFMRTDPKNIFLRAEIAAGNFGTITRVAASNCHNGSLGGWFDKEWRWMADPKIAGVGAFGDLGTHQLDILMWMLGDIESVAAEIHPVTHRYGDCDETGESLIRFKNGVIGNLAAGWVDIEDPIKLLISGTQGHAFIMNDHVFYHSLKRPGSDNRRPWTDLPAPTKAPMNQFLDAVGGSKTEPLVAPREAASRVTVMQAMYEAAHKHQWIAIG